jgi:hypothetical protein
MCLEWRADIERSPLLVPNRGAYAIELHTSDGSAFDTKVAPELEDPPLGAFYES